MSTAIQWAERFSTAPDVLVECREFLDEIRTSSEKRGGTLFATEGAIKEQKNKFFAVCRHTDSVNPDMFDELLGHLAPHYVNAQVRYAHVEDRFKTRPNHRKAAILRMKSPRQLVRR